MLNEKDKQSKGLISNVFSLAKKINTTRSDMLNHIVSNRVTTLTHTPHKDQVVEGSAHEHISLENQPNANPQQMLRQHLPQISSQLLGRRYKNVHQVTSFISPELNHKISDYFFEKLNTFVSQSSSVDKILNEVGVKNLDDLAKDPARSQRISQALANQNKLIAAAQGALSGATGVIGSAIDIPTSIGLALRSIYQTGRAHGFELKPEDHLIVEYIFRQINIASVAEKQALLATVRTFANVVQTHDIYQLQQILGSGNDVELLRKWLMTEDGSYRWAWLNHIPQISMLSKFTPLASSGISAFYSWQLVDHATHTAQNIFSTARQYLIQHPDQDIDALSAYEKANTLRAQADPILLNSEASTSSNVSESKSIDSIENAAITDIKIEKKTETRASESDISVSIQQGLQDLADTHVLEQKENVVESKPVKRRVASTQTKANKSVVKPVQNKTVSTKQNSDTQKDDQPAVTKRRSVRKTANNGDIAQNSD